MEGKASDAIGFGDLAKVQVLRCLMEKTLGGSKEGKVWDFVDLVGVTVGKCQLRASGQDMNWELISCNASRTAVSSQH